MTTSIAAEKKTLGQPDEVRTFEKGRLDLVDIGGGSVGRLTLEPGWKWSVHVKPVAGTELCEAPHFQYHASGVLARGHGRRHRVRRSPRRHHRVAVRARRLGRRRRAGGAHRLERREQLRQGLILV